MREKSTVDSQQPIGRSDIGLLNDLVVFLSIFLIFSSYHKKDNEQILSFPALESPHSPVLSSRLKSQEDNMFGTSGSSAVGGHSV